ncbi:SIGNAL-TRANSDUCTION SENSOR PROTEIN-PAS/PAC domain [hydrothermal vent metagenome]|uniref:SIGNAL-TRANSDUCTION SENSOR PROTEIN-PAS/PAC domain n=1 Tax=hydrothermal vent metagenome TaxID=652676 RepID=A0A1W1EL80_9ZZZZ
MGITPTNIEQEVRDIDVIISKGDANGDITYANPIFFKLAGYEQAELLDKPHSIIRHPDMPQIIFKTLWDNLKSGNELHTFVKNLSKDGSFYWVYAFIRVATNPDGSFRNYVSTRKSMSKRAREVIEPLYAKLRKAEEIGNMQESLKILEDFLASEGASLETFNEAMIKLQNS